MSNDAELRAREAVWPAMNAAYDAAVADNPHLMECGLSNDELREAFMVGLIAARPIPAASERSHDGEWEAMRERCAKVAEDMPKTIPLPDRVIPAHDEMDDFGEPVFHVGERVIRRSKHTTPKDVAEAIRSLSAVSLSDDVGCK